MRPARILRPLAALGFAAALTVGLCQTATTAAFTAQTGQSGNQVSAAASLCTAPGRVDTLTTGTVDTALYESNPVTNYNTDVRTRVSSTAPGRARTLIRFDLSGRPAGCTAQSATLTMRVISGTAGATVAVCRAAAAWDPTTVTWNRDPGFVGPCASAPGVGNGVTVTWNVATQVNGLVSGPDHGFELKYTAESGTSYTQQYESMEAPPLNRPKLQITWG